MPKKRTFNHGDAIARSRKACERLGTDTPACSVCGETRAIILEKHHVAGRAYDPNTMILCLNYHGLLSNAQKDHPTPFGDEPTALERIGRMLLNLADLLALLIETFKKFGSYLIELAKDQSKDGSDQP